MPLIDLSTVYSKKSVKWLHNLHNSHFKNLSIAETEYVLSQMGEVMSLRKLGRKIGLMATIIYEFEIGEEFSAEKLNQTARKYICDKMSLTNDSVGAILRLFKKWGVVHREPKLIGGRVIYIRMR
mgnify:FL=1|jgi:hypothetical protein|tara:strand:- start:1601 stop:1975 length:375 start_codon:yes stop_codon:yes gene_type:complete